MEILHGQHSEQKKLTLSQNKLMAEQGSKFLHNIPIPIPYINFERVK